MSASHETQAAVDRTADPLDDPDVDPAVDVGGFDIDALFRREYQPMVRVAFLVLGDRELAEDVVQDAFAHVQERAARLREPGAYLRRCVVNGCNDKLRRRRRADAAVHLLGRVDDSSPDGDHVIDAVRSLSRRRRTAVVLRYYLDWSEVDIAGAMGVRPGTVKALLHQGIDELRKVVER